MARAPAGAALLNTEVTQAIIKAALSELADVGYARLSMGTVARRAGAGKAAIYRRWSSKEAMIIEVLRTVVMASPETPDTGSLRGDLLAFLESNTRWLTGTWVSRIFPDLIAESARDEAFGGKLYETVGAPRRARGNAILDRAAERGELSPDMDRELALDLLAGPLFWRLAVTKGSVGPEFHPVLADVLVAALQAVPAPAASG